MPEHNLQSARTAFENLVHMGQIIRDGKLHRIPSETLLLNIADHIESVGLPHPMSGMIRDTFESIAASKMEAIAAELSAVEDAANAKPNQITDRTNPGYWYAHPITYTLAQKLKKDRALISGELAFVATEYGSPKGTLLPLEVVTHWLEDMA